MQVSKIFFTLAFVFSISSLAHAQMTPIYPVADTLEIVDNTPEWNWNKEPDTPVSIEDDFSRQPIRTPLTPSVTPQGSLYFLIKYYLLTE